MHRVFACPVKIASPSSADCFDSFPLLYFMVSSHFISLHQGTKITFLSFNLAMNSFQEEACEVIFAILSLALINIFYWILLSSSGIFSYINYHFRSNFSPLYLKTHCTFCWSTSLGPVDAGALASRAKSLITKKDGKTL